MVGEHPHVVLDLRGNAFSFSPLNMMLPVGLSQLAFIMLSYILSMPTFWRVFTINRCWILSKAFSPSIKMIIWFLFFNLSLQFVILQLYFDWFADIEESLHSWDKPHLIMVYDPFTCCWILFASILLRIFASLFISDIGL